MDSYHLLHNHIKRPAKTNVKHRQVKPAEPLEVIKMDIKYQWVNQHQRYAFILTILDCFPEKLCTGMSLLYKKGTGDYSLGRCQKKIPPQSRDGIHYNFWSKGNRRSHLSELNYVTWKPIY